MIYAQSIELERLLSFPFSVTAAWLLPAKLLLHDFYQGSAAECLSLDRPQPGHSFPTYSTGVHSLSLSILFSLFPHKLLVHTSTLLPSKLKKTIMQGPTALFDSSHADPFFCAHKLP